MKKINKSIQLRLLYKKHLLTVVEKKKKSSNLIVQLTQNL